MTETWLIVGLGNPGPEYSHNRHNVGQMVLDELASRVGGGFKSHKSRAQVLEGRLGIGGPRIVLAKPLTYMNVSGGPVSALAQFYGRDGKPSLDRYVVVQVLVGTDRVGVNRDASRYGATAVFVFVFDGSAVRTLSRLGDLPAALAAMK